MWCFPGFLFSGCALRWRASSIAAEETKICFQSGTSSRLYCNDGTLIADEEDDDDDDDEEEEEEEEEEENDDDDNDDKIERWNSVVYIYIHIFNLMQRTYISFSLNVKTQISISRGLI